MLTGWKQKAFVGEIFREHFRHKHAVSDWGGGVSCQHFAPCSALLRPRTNRSAALSSPSSTGLPPLALPGHRASVFFSSVSSVSKPERSHFPFIRQPTDRQQLTVGCWPTQYVVEHRSYFAHILTVSTWIIWASTAPGGMGMQLSYINTTQDRNIYYIRCDLFGMCSWNLECPHLQSKTVFLTRQSTCPEQMQICLLQSSLLVLFTRD